MNKIKFTVQWDKLSHPMFTTIRSWNIAKEEYYLKQIGTKFQVWMANDTYPFRRRQLLFHAWLADVEVVNIASIPIATLYQDILFQGVPDISWKDKLLKMGRGIMLTFSKSPDPLQRRLETGSVDAGEKVSKFDLTEFSCNLENEGK